MLHAIVLLAKLFGSVYYTIKMTNGIYKLSQHECTIEISWFDMILFCAFGVFLGYY